MKYQPCDIPRWGQAELWDLMDAAQILAGIEPVSVDEMYPKAADAVLTKLMQAIQLGTLPCVRQVEDRIYFFPLQMIDWARRTAHQLPAGLKDEVTGAIRLEMRQVTPPPPPRDLIPFNEACELLHGRLGSTAPELAMWIFQGDISAWCRDGLAFQFSEAEKPANAETAAQMLMEMELRLSGKDVGALQPDERYLAYPDVLAKIRAKFTDSYSATLSDELVRFLEEMTPKIDRAGEPIYTPIGGRPMVASVIPGGGYARRVEDGLFFRSEIDKFISSRDLVIHHRTAELDRPAPDSPETSASVVTPQQRQAWQEAQILNVIETLGLVAGALPKPQPGKSGVKAQVRTSLDFTQKVFDLAWERLRADGRIADCNP